MRNQFLLYISLGILFSCTKEQAKLADLNKHCSDAKRVSAEFFIEEPIAPPAPSFVSSQKYIPTDTAYGNKNIRFRALEVNAEYTWYLGSEVIHDSAFSRYFSEDFFDETIKVTLVVRKKPNLICFPDDDGFDSIIKYIHLVEKEYSNPIKADGHLFKGVFRLKDSLNKNSDSIDVTLSYNINPLSVGVPSKLIVYDLFSNKDSINVFLGKNFNAYRYWWMEMEERFYQFRMFHSMEGIVTILLEDDFDNYKPVYYFKGRKLN